MDSILANPTALLPLLSNRDKRTVPTACFLTLHLRAVVVAASRLLSLTICRELVTPQLICVRASRRSNHLEVVVAQNPSPTSSFLALGTMLEGGLVNSKVKLLYVILGHE